MVSSQIESPGSYVVGKWYLSAGIWYVLADNGTVNGVYQALPVSIS